MNDAPEPPAIGITVAEKELGVVRIGKSADGKPIAFFANGTFSYRASIEACKARG